MRALIGFLLLAAAVNAHAGPSYLGTDLQAVSLDSANVSGNLPTAIREELPTGTKNIGTVTGSQVSLSSGSHSMAVNADGSLNTVTTVTPSTQTLRGRSGSTITSETVGSNEGLHVVNLARPDLAGKVFVYKSSDSMAVAGVLTLTGLANQVDLQAIGNDCTFTLGSGDPINVAKNTGESYSFDYTASNLAVTLTAKTGTATCKVRMTGAN